MLILKEFHSRKALATVSKTIARGKTVAVSSLHFPAPAVHARPFSTDDQISKSLEEILNRTASELPETNAFSQEPTYAKRFGRSSDRFGDRSSDRFGGRSSDRFGDRSSDRFRSRSSDRFGGSSDRFGGGLRRSNPFRTRNYEGEEEEELINPFALDEGAAVKTANPLLDFSKYEIPVTTEGKNVPPPIESLEKLSLPDTIINNVKAMGITNLFPIQKYAMSILSHGQDLIACAQTGSGKTIAFLLPAIQQLLTSQRPATRTPSPRVVVICPTRELAQQIATESLKVTAKTPIITAAVFGGSSHTSQLTQLQKGCDILVGTPGRINDFVSNGFLSFKDVKYLVLDEADRMLDMGFKPQIDSIVNEMPPTNQRQTSMFSATFPKEVRRLAADLLKPDHVFMSVGRIGATADLVEQQFFKVESGSQKFELAADLMKKNPGPTLIFVDRKLHTLSVCDRLTDAGISADSLHGDKNQYQRNRALFQFNKSQIQCLVATNVAARGLDLPNVSHVINFDFPSYIDDYVHRVGRTGRAGRKGLASSFLTGKEPVGVLKDLVEQLQNSKVKIPPWIQSLINAPSSSGRQPMQRSFLTQRPSFSRFSEQRRR